MPESERRTGLSTRVLSRLSISAFPLRLQTMFAGGFASASHRNSTLSRPSSTSLDGVPTRRTSGGSATKNRQGEHLSPSKTQIHTEHESTSRKTSQKLKGTSPRSKLHNSVEMCVSSCESDIVPKEDSKTQPCVGLYGD